MKVNIRDATPLQLNYLVAKCEGQNLQFHDHWMKADWKAKGYPDSAYHGHLPFQTYQGQWVVIETFPSYDQYGRKVELGRPVPLPNYSTDRDQGGLIIEREGICTQRLDSGEWTAYYTQGIMFTQCGPTPLIAGMRCFVASRLGDEVEIPEELR